MCAAVASRQPLNWPKAAHATPYENHCVLASKKLQAKKDRQVKHRLMESIEKRAAARQSFKQGCAVEEVKSQPQFLQHFQRAIDEGLLQSEAGIYHFLTDIGSALVGGKQHRQLSNTSKCFYLRLLSVGGQMVHQWVSDFLLGPALSTTKKGRQAFDYPLGIGWDERFLAVIHMLVEAWGLLNAPCIISEDGTSLQHRLDVVSVREDIHIFGLNGGSIKVCSVEELIQAQGERGLATTLYVYTLVPLVAGAPHFPLYALTHDNSNGTFSGQQVLQEWQRLWQVVRACGLQLVGHSADGDARIRQLTQTVCINAPNSPDAHYCLRLAHPLIQLVLPQVDPGNPVSIFIASDWMHIIWRLRQRFLNAALTLELGGMPIVPSRLFGDQGRALGLNAADTDAKNKQSLDGAIKIFDLRRQKPSGKCEEVPLTDQSSTRRVYLVHPEDRAGYMFLEFGHRYLRTFMMEERDMDAVLHDCAFCITFVGIWRRDVLARPGVDLRKGFLTRETATDVLTSCQTLVLAVMLFREHYPHVKMVPSRLSSRFSEYVFSHLRSATKTSDLVNASQYCYIIKSHLLVQLMEAWGVDIPQMKATRSKAHGPDRIDKTWSKCDPGYYPSDEGFGQALDAGAWECIDMLCLPLDNEALGNGQPQSLWQMLLPALPALNLVNRTPATLHLLLKKLPLLSDPQVENDLWKKTFPAWSPGPVTTATSSNSANHAEDARQQQPADAREGVEGGPPEDIDEEALDDEMPRPAFASSDQWGRVPEGAWQVMDNFEDSDMADGHLDLEATSQLQKLQQQLKGLMASASHGGHLEDEMDDMQAAGEDSTISARHAAIMRQIRQKIRQINAQISIQSRDRDRRFHGPKPREYDQAARDDDDTISANLDHERSVKRTAKQAEIPSAPQPRKMPSSQAGSSRIDRDQHLGNRTARSLASWITNNPEAGWDLFQQAFLERNPGSRQNN
ncbi:hypothetical protein WJX74_009162 [Apatococcus lobatus]|uniref:Uncharacterized protein n=1 Tax=Apatococcus lobatus TaxID=904363 RepID=A0AAW1QM15_9CHLO